MRTELCAIAFVMLWSPLAAQMSAPPTAPELPKHLRAAIDEALDKLDGDKAADKADTYKDWRVATVDAPRTPCWQAAGAPPAMVQGDLNGDGLLDYAVLVQGSDRTRLIAALDRVAEPMVVDIEAAPPADGYLAVEKKGQPYVDPENDTRDFFTNDTVVVQRCGQPRDAYFWNGFAFRKVTLAPSID